MKIFILLESYFLRIRLYSTHSFFNFFQFFQSNFVYFLQTNLEFIFKIQISTHHQVGKYCGTILSWRLSPTPTLPGEIESVILSYDLVVPKNTYFQTVVNAKG